VKREPSAFSIAVLLVAAALVAGLLWLWGAK
jgi:hypothetical protein